MNGDRRGDRRRVGERVWEAGEGFVILGRMVNGAREHVDGHLSMLLRDPKGPDK